MLNQPVNKPGYDEIAFAPYEMKCLKLTFKPK